MNNELKENEVSPMMKQFIADRDKKAGKQPQVEVNNQHGEVSEMMQAYLRNLKNKK